MLEAATRMHCLPADTLTVTCPINHLDHHQATQVIVRESILRLLQLYISTQPSSILVCNELLVWLQTSVIPSPNCSQFLAEY